ncbi:MAG: SDR family oxidoreductase [Rhodobacter sp.]|jgi:3-oxoacyl-[acyl-carrier protein] reductase|nr:SDR family oxidoreductase [Rhodobacter sp.]MCA3458160.1 SDR family oxidoreductase [Rhodobacter sp.]MCA3459991.1 SDR family oxidoreductase [Rhodobacter sp.]MCA3465550.1 SDR family oxidoreductase [Rhodobacter sp.]MCA3467527.1 SDR family oxidoreductase [Rhodobacter sp.]
MTLTGRTALITGAAGAIGSAAARLLSQAGARLVLADMVRDPTEDLSRELGGLAVQADLSDPGAVSGMAASVLDQVGRIDILVNNAGALNNAKIATTTLEEWHRVQSINVDAAFLLSQAFLPGMRAARWGRVINLSSYAAKSGGLTAGTAYSVSKAAMIGLTFSIAREVAGEGVTANAIAPAYVMSPMVSEQLTDAQRQTQLAAIPVGRFCEPEEVAHAVMFLASPLAGFITGEVIDMNGGMHFD